ncbi:uncharacterized protein LOC111088741 isoform X2 [Limulus polyphemus]|uniref:Uncharacterized protein LOC111088741 isoform X2 n=1 Tax=Limulus polyphemus TaxID=6850 RepID=A0ABM1THH0_LIMPO|nr:uncharacterized protein LOC111088741 isoform X2 [Limulus polyphemus]
MKLLDEIFEGTADFVGKSPVEGPLTEVSLQRCLKSLPMFSEELQLEQLHPTWNVQFNGQCLTASCNKLGSYEIQRVDVKNVVHCHLPKESSRTIVWVVTGVGREEAKEAWVWRCAMEKDVVQLYHMFQEMVEKWKDINVPDYGPKKRENGDNTSFLVAEGLSFKKSVDQPKTVRPAGCPHIKITLISQTEEDEKLIAVNDPDSTIPGKHRESHQNSNVPTTEEKPKVPPRTRKKTPPPRPPRGVTKQGISKSSQTAEKLKTSNPPTWVQEQTFNDVRENKGLIEVPAEVEDSTKNVNREVLVAVTRSSRDRKPISTRQREPAKLLVSRPDEKQRESSRVSRGLSPHRSAGEVSLGRLVRNLLGADTSNHSNPEAVKSIECHLNRQRNRSSLAIRDGYLWHQESWRDGNSNNRIAVPYTRWMNKAGSGDPQIHCGVLKKVFGNKSPNGVTDSKMYVSSEYPSSGSRLELLEGSPILLDQLKSKKFKNVGFQSRASHLIRCGSLTSDESDNGLETKPKSVLKKPKSFSGDGSHESKKNVTFNTMTTVQVMEE